MKNILAILAIALCASVSVVGAAETIKAGEPGLSSPSSASVLVNLNTADADTLQRELSGVGAVKAQAIVSYREQHGSFASVDELLEVKGIGEGLFEKNRDKLSVK